MTGMNSIPIWPIWLVLIVAGLLALIAHGPFGFRRNFGASKVGRPGPLWLLPTITSSLAVIVYGPFGVSRDFGAFMTGLFLLLPLLAAASFGSLVWLLVSWRSPMRSRACSAMIAALAPLLLIPACWQFGGPLRDPIRFAVWSMIHGRQLDIASRKAGIVVHWDAWGSFVTADFDSYLASDPTDTLGQEGAADRWAKSQRLGCVIVDARRMRRAIYIVTTIDCRIKGF